MTGSGAKKPGQLRDGMKKTGRTEWGKPWVQVRSALATPPALVPGPRTGTEEGRGPGPQELDHYIRKQHMWENTLAPPADHRHVRGCPDRKGTRHGGGSWGWAAPTELKMTLWVVLATLDKGHCPAGARRAGGNPHGQKAQIHPMVTNAYFPTGKATHWVLGRQKDPG